MFILMNNSLNVFAGTTHQSKRIEAVEIVIVPCTHDWSNYTADEIIGEAQPTHTRTCRICGMTETEDCNMQLSFKEHTCTEDGWVGHLECTVCERNKDNRQVTKASHTYSEELEQIDYTGHYRVCTVCGEKEKMPHTLKMRDMGNGEHANACDCGYINGKPEAHTYVYKVSANGEKHYQECTKCHTKTEETDHIEKATEGTEEGHKVVCENCGKVLKENIAHVFDIYKDTTPWTDKNEGSHTVLCACGFSKVEPHEFGGISKEYIPHTRHEHGGERATRTCAKCGDSYSWWFRRDSDFKHIWVKDESSNDGYVCSICGLKTTKNNVVNELKENIQNVIENKEKIENKCTEFNEAKKSANGLTCLGDVEFDENSNKITFNVNDSNKAQQEFVYNLLIQTKTELFHFKELRKEAIKVEALVDNKVVYTETATPPDHSLDDTQMIATVKKMFDGMGGSKISDLKKPGILRFTYKDTELDLEYSVDLTMEFANKN